MSKDWEYDKIKRRKRGIWRNQTAAHKRRVKYVRLAFNRLSKVVKERR